MWACWGEYEYLSPTRWLHNLEHGGVAFLYHPCAPTELIENLREYARKYQTGDNEDFRWVMTPYPHLPSAIGVVTWGWVYSAQCIRPSEIDAFIAQHYRKAAEDIAVDGTYSKGYLGR
jgi:hypothetical protein